MSGPARRGLAAAALATATCTLLFGCGRGRAIAADGERVEHRAGFSMLVPDEWELRDTGTRVRLVGRESVHDGFPTLTVTPLEASALPDDFLDGRRFHWSGGSASYRYRRWANSLGNGVRLTVYLQGERVSLQIDSDLWDRSVRMDRRHFRRRVWPVINSIVELPADG